MSDICLKGDSKRVAGRLSRSVTPGVEDSSPALSFGLSLGLSQKVPPFIAFQMRNTQHGKQHGVCDRQQPYHNVHNSPTCSHRRTHGAPVGSVAQNAFTDGERAGVF